MTTHVFVNDLPYAVGSDDPINSLADTLAFSADDWSASRAMAWVWGIVCGWDDDSFTELAPRFRWTAEQVERLKRLRANFERLEAAPVSTDRETGES